MSNPTTPIHRAPLSQQHRRVITTTSPDAIGAQVSVVIDGVEAKVPFGTTILEAAKNAGVTIPTLCDHPDLDVAGVCRMCVVEVEGQRTLQPACTFPVVNQMKINTHTRKVRMAR
jgi:NADH dehydrogenase/NADH:ubiquinone oxidoreductase subunit G